MSSPVVPVLGPVEELPPVVEVASLEVIVIEVDASEDVVASSVSAMGSIEDPHAASIEIVPTQRRIRGTLAARPKRG